MLYLLFVWLLPVFSHKPNNPGRIWESNYHQQQSIAQQNNQHLIWSYPAEKTVSLNLLLVISWFCTLAAVHHQISKSNNILFISFRIIKRTKPNYKGFFSCKISSLFMTFKKKYFFATKTNIRIKTVSNLDIRSIFLFI